MALVSVCIPTYNGVKYLKAAIASVLHQTFADFELIIVDDGSTEGSEAIIELFADDRLEFFRNPARLGLVGNWNRCIQLATGKYVCVFHQDDVMLEPNLAEKVNILENNPAVGFIYSDVFMIDDEGNTIATGWSQKTEPYRDFIQSGANYFQTLITGHNLICCPSVLARRECYEKLGDFDARLSFTADWEMWLRIALFYDVAYLAKPLLHYRWHTGNETSMYTGAKGLREQYRAKMIALEKYPERIPGILTLRRSIIQDQYHQAVDMAAHYLAGGNDIKARECLSLIKEFQTDMLEHGALHNNMGSVSPAARDASTRRSTTFEKDYPSDLSEIIKSHHDYQQKIINEMSAEDVARQIPIHKIIKAIGHKILALRWLRRLGKPGQPR